MIFILSLLSEIFDFDVIIFNHLNTSHIPWFWVLSFGQFSPLVDPGDDMTSSKVPDAPPMALLLAIELVKGMQLFI